MTHDDVSFTSQWRGDGTLHRARVGVLHTPHGSVRTPAFIPVGTAATVKTLTPQHVRSTGAEAVLSNAYHLYLRPGSDVVDDAGGLSEFMAWNGPTYTDSGGFQVMSLGAGFKKIIDMTGKSADDGAVASGHERLADVDDDGVTFRSHLDGSSHRFTPELSMQIQHQLGADVMFAFDELTTLMNSRSYQEQAVARTQAWAERCLVEHNRLTNERTHRPKQSLWAVLQGAQYEDLRRKATRDLMSLSASFTEKGERGFGGWGIGGAFEKENLGTIVGWCVDELPDHMPRHLLGISEPDDVFTAVENGADTFDCVAPTRAARHGTLLTRQGRIRLRAARYKRDYSPLDPESSLPEATQFTRAYVHHLMRCGEHLGSVLVSLLNITFMVDLMADIRAHLEAGTYEAFRDETLARYYGNSA